MTSNYKKIIKENLKNASSFMPLDGLADVAEYTSKAILQIRKGNL
jgi:hypothetical protein